MAEDSKNLTWEDSTTIAPQISLSSHSAIKTLKLQVIDHALGMWFSLKGNMALEGGLKHRQDKSPGPTSEVHLLIPAEMKESTVQFVDAVMLLFWLF